MTSAVPDNAHGYADAAPELLDSLFYAVSHDLRSPLLTVSLSAQLLEQTLGESVVRALLEQPCVPLPPPEFVGTGIYALYYAGEFAAYAPISSADCGTPIYVGKAEPPGRRTGLASLDSS
jgi:hypothetical protein